MRRQRRVKIVATLGPASSTPEMIEKLFVAGADVFRVNMSHSGPETAHALVRAVRDVSAKHRCSIGVLCDLQGPKFRLGEFQDGVTLVKAGELFRFDQSGLPGTSQRVSLPHSAIFEAVKPGDAFLIDDGKLRMRVVEGGKGDIVAEVVTGGIMSSRKGLTMPDTLLPVSALTEKDHKDLDLALKLGADWIALSFVQRAEDVIEAKRIIDGRAAVLAKIEKPSAIEEIDDIIARWTAGLPLETLERRLVEAGVPATRIYTIADIFGDPHYRARGSIVSAEDDELGSVAMAAVVPRLSDTPGRVRHSGRRTGQDTRRVLRSLLGMPDARIDELAAAGAIRCES